MQICKSWIITKFAETRKKTSPMGSAKVGGEGGLQGHAGPRSTGEGEMKGELGLGASPRWRQIGSTTGRHSSYRSKQKKPAGAGLAVETNRRGSEDDLLVLFTGGTTARAEQGGGVGSQMEVRDGSVQGHAPVNKRRERQSLERRDS